MWYRAFIIAVFNCNCSICFLRGYHYIYNATYPGNILIMERLSAFFIGLLFGLGLTISNMINPYKILNFLDFFGYWDPTLLVVMVSAVLTTFIGYRFVLKKE